MKVYRAGYISNKLKEDQPVSFWINHKAGAAEDQT